MSGRGGFTFTSTDLQDTPQPHPVPPKSPSPSASTSSVQQQQSIGGLYFEGRVPDGERSSRPAIGAIPPASLPTRGFTVSDSGTLRNAPDAESLARRRPLNAGLERREHLKRTNHIYWLAWQVAGELEMEPEELLDVGATEYMRGDTDPQQQLQQQQPNRPAGSKLWLPADYSERVLILKIDDQARAAYNANVGVDVQKSTDALVEGIQRFWANNLKIQQPQHGDFTNEERRQIVNQLTNAHATRKATLEAIEQNIGAQDLLTVFNLKQDMFELQFAFTGGRRAGIDYSTLAGYHELLSAVVEDLNKTNDQLVSIIERWDARFNRGQLRAARAAAQSLQQIAAQDSTERYDRRWARLPENIGSFALKNNLERALGRAFTEVSRVSRVVIPDEWSLFKRGDKHVQTEYISLIVGYLRSNGLLRQKRTERPRDTLAQIHRRESEGVLRFRKLAEETGSGQYYFIGTRKAAQVGSVFSNRSAYEADALWERVGGGAAYVPELEADFEERRKNITKGSKLAAWYTQKAVADLSTGN